MAIIWDVSCDYDIKEAGYSILPSDSLIPADGFYVRFDVKNKFKNAIYPPSEDCSQLYESFSEEDTSLSNYSHRDVFKPTEDKIAREFLDGKYITPDIQDRILQQIETLAFSLADQPGNAAPKLLLLSVGISISACRYGYDAAAAAAAAVRDASLADEFDEEDYAHDEDLFAQYEMEFDGEAAQSITDDDVSDDMMEEEEEDDMEFDDIEEVEEDNMMIDGSAATQLNWFDELGLDERRFEAAVDPINTTCTVCLEEFSEGEKVILMPCKHVYHKECIQRWLQDNNVCPLCRFEIILPN